jgi:hypothetical protein
MRRFATRVLALAHKEWMHIVRDVRTLYFALVMPVVMLMIFGYAVSFDIDGGSSWSRTSTPRATSSRSCDRCCFVVRRSSRSRVHWAC